MSNNPFASAMNEPDSYVHHRDPPPVPRGATRISLPRNGSNNSSTPPPRPPKSDAVAPPAYDEVTDKRNGRHGSREEYPREKLSSRDRPERPERPDRPDRPDRPERSDRERSERSERSHRERSSDNTGSRRDKPRREHSSREHSSSVPSSRDPKDRHSRDRLKKSPKKKVEPIKPKNLDSIDKLDVTGFFGGGFHHDGPFDACTPHRNKNAKLAPVMAYHPDGPNNSIKGMANVVKEKEQQMNLAYGNFNDDQNEIVGRRTSIKKNDVEVRTSSVGASNNVPDTIYTANPSIINFDARTKAIPVHGSTTAGLGSTTFIDGAPAPKIAEQEFLAVGGLNRKKSIVQRLRKNSASENSSRRNSNDSPSPDGSRRGSLNPEEKDQLVPPLAASLLLRRVKSLKVRR